MHDLLAVIVKCGYQVVEKYSKLVYVSQVIQNHTEKEFMWLRKDLSPNSWLGQMVMFM